MLCAILGLLVFFQDPGDLGGRISVIVTVFLAMTAIQFVLNDSTPQSTYIQPLQQCILIIYICFSVSAIESIIVYNLVHWKDFSAERQARKASWKKYKRRLHEWRHYTTLERDRDARRGRDLEEYASGDGQYSDSSFVDALDADPGADVGTGGFEATNGLSGTEGTKGVEMSTKKTIGFGATGLMRRLREGMRPSKGGSTDVDDRTLRRTDTDGKPTVASILREDADYGKALAWYIDRWTFALEALCYVIAIPTIFATQSGYVPLFNEEVLERSGLG